MIDWPIKLLFTERRAHKEQPASCLAFKVGLGAGEATERPMHGLYITISTLSLQFYERGFVWYDAFFTQKPMNLSFEWEYTSIPLIRRGFHPNPSHKLWLVKHALYFKTTHHDSPHSRPF